MKTITATVPAWITTSGNIENLDGTPEQAVCEAYFYEHDMTRSGWTRIGTATITLNIISTDGLVQNQVAALEAEMNAVLADAQQKCNYFRERISKLQALTFEAPEVEA